MFTDGSWTWDNSGKAFYVVVTCYITLEASVLSGIKSVQAEELIVVTTVAILDSGFNMKSALQIMYLWCLSHNREKNLK